MKNKTQGYYSGKYTVSMKKYSGIDFSKRCFVFAGQGPATPGMFREEYNRFSVIREKFVLAEKITRPFRLPKISDYILHPENLEEDSMPVVSNIALFTLEIALFDILKTLQIVPEKVTGHSFGEYSALVASGIVSFEEMITIIYHRDIFCPKVHSAGLLVAVNADVKYIQKVLVNQPYFISNINSPYQTVIAVSQKHVNEIEHILQVKKIKCKVLYTVPQPYHSPYLLPSQKKIETFLRKKNFSLKKPIIPIFSSVLKKEINQKNFRKSDIEKILFTQIVTQVDFIQQIRSLYHLKCYSFLEISPKRIFSTFIEDILSNQNQKVKIEYIQSFLEKEEKKENENSVKNKELFKKIREIISKNTGYEKEKIYSESRFQEELGIDSIKKTDILLTIFDTLDITIGDDFNTSSFKNINDIILYVERVTKKDFVLSKKNGEKGKKKRVCFQRYEFLPVKENISNSFDQKICDDGVFLFDIKDIFDSHNDFLKRWRIFQRKTKKDTSFTIIMQVRNKNLEYEDILFLFSFFQEFFRPLKQNIFRFMLLSFGLKQHRGVSSLASFFKSLKKEIPTMFFRYIQSDRVDDPKTFLTEMNEMSGNDSMYKKGIRYSIKPVLIPEEKPISPQKKSVILAIGGASGITFSLLLNIAKKTKSSLYIIGRKKQGEKLVTDNIALLKKYTPYVSYISCDAQDKNAMEKVWKQIIQDHKCIDYVINGAGTVDVSFLQDKTREAIQSEFRNKILPARNVLQLALKYHPRRILNFSSIFSRYGGAGQSIYASANEWVNEMTQEYSQKLKKYHSTVVSLNWPAWDNTGMTAEKNVSQKLKEYGVSLLHPSHANRLFFIDLYSQREGSLYYLSETDDHIFSFTLNNFTRYASVIGEAFHQTSSFMSPDIFKRVLYISHDRWLDDHRIQGLRYVPFAVGIGMFLCFERMFSQKRIALKNITVHNPLIVREDPVECFVERKEERKKIQFSLRSKVMHFSAQAVYEEEKNQKKYLPIIQSKKMKMQQKDIYSVFEQKTGISYGPIFQVLDEIWRNKTNSFCSVIDNTKLFPIFGVPFYDKLIQWIEASLQTLGLSFIEEKKGVFLPVSIGKITFLENEERTQFFYPVVLSRVVNINGVRGDVLVMNEKGKKILLLEDIFLQEKK